MNGDPQRSGAALPPHTPSSLATIEGGRARVGGRVTRCQERELVLRDALGELRVEIAGDTELPLPGDLVVVEGTLSDRGGAPAAKRALSGARVLRTDHRPGAHPLNETTRLVDGGVAEALRRRAAIMATIRRIFERRSYLEVETATLVPSPGLDLHLDAFQVGQPANAPSYLITSPEYQMKRLLCGGLPRIFQIARCYRRGELGGRHNPEFTMLEWYRTFADIDSMMDETEQLVRSVLDAHGTVGESIPLLGASCDWSAPFLRITVSEAFARFAGVEHDDMLRLATGDEERFFRILVTRVEPALAKLGKPAFLRDYPATQASLARLKPSDPSLCERFELYVGDLELCNGFGELTDAVEQRARLQRDQRERRARGKPDYPIDERFIAALSEGMPPCAGNALGIDRLVALCCGASSIADVLANPASWL